MLSLIDPQLRPGLVREKEEEAVLRSTSSLNRSLAHRAGLSCTQVKILPTSESLIPT